MPKNVLTGLPRVVRHRHGLHLQRTDVELCVPFDGNERMGGFTATAGRRSPGHVDRNIESTRQRRDANAVVGVFVGDKDGIQRGGIQPDTRQTLLRFPDREAAIDKDVGVAGDDDRGITLAAATQGGEAQRAVN